MQLFNMRQRQLGIGLLELMLSLAIIAILLIMATRYYQSASDANKRNQAVDMMSAVNGAVQNYKIDNAALLADVDMTALIDAGYLPPSYGSTGAGANPWGGDISVAVDGTSDASVGTFTVTMSDVSPTSCVAVALRVNGTIAGASTSGSTAAAGVVGSLCSGSTTVIAVYNL